MASFSQSPSSETSKRRRTVFPPEGAAGDAQVENLQLISCTNRQYGCDMVMLYNELDEHAGNCLHHPCYCPYSNCQFIGPTESTCNHIRDVHKESIINFNYGRKIEVVLPRSYEFNFKVIAEVDCLFLLQRREREDTLLRQSALSVFCLRASDPFEKPQFLFELKMDLVGSPVGAFIALGQWVEHSLCDAELNHSDASLHVPSRFCAPNGDIHVSVTIKKPEPSNPQ